MSDEILTYSHQYSSENVLHHSMKDRIRAIIVIPCFGS